MSANSLVFDLKLFSADTKIRKNLLSARTAVTKDPAHLKEDGLSLGPGEITSLPTVDNTNALCLYSTVPVKVTTRVDNNVANTVFENQTLLVITSNVSSVALENTSLQKATIFVARLALYNPATPVQPIPRQLVTFSALSRITALPQAITNIGNVTVEDITLFVFTNDQVTAPAVGGASANKFRICNSDGTPNSNGAYLMILDDLITQQNFSGTLQFWIEEVA